MHPHQQPPPYPQQQPQGPGGPYGPPMGPPPRGHHRPPQRMSGGTVALITIAGVIGALGVLGGLVRLLDGGGKPTAKASASASPSPSAEPTVPFVSNVPRPDARQAEDLLYGLRRIDRELDRARSIGRARNSCWDLLQNKSRSVVVENTRLRFDGVADIDTADAQAIVKLIEDGGWCR